MAVSMIPSSSQAQPAPLDVPLLDVPYLPQSEALCGAAAIAMVMRYWGATGVYAETFADLVDAEAGGIRGSELIRALESRGFAAMSFRGDLERIQTTLEKRHPIVALIEDRPGRLHYVVIVGWRGDRVIVHDPARAPYRVMRSEAFLQAWAVSGFWTLLAQPESAAARFPPPQPEEEKGTSRSGGVCAGMVEEGIRLAGVDDLPGAERVLDLAAVDCPSDPAPLRELAGIHALRGDWVGAARDAGRALERDADDRHALRTLATSLFLLDQEDEALDAWNRIGAPLVDIADIRGLERTRFDVVASALDLAPQTLLTRDGLARARRRLGSLPAVIGSRVTYEPDEHDRAKVSAAVVERPLLPTGLIPLAATAVRSISDRELTFAVASPAGGGELWSGSWRWWERRPRVALELAAPSPFGGVWSLEAYTERQSYGDLASILTERRRGVVLNAADWLTGTTQLELSGAFDNWDAGSTGSIRGGVTRLMNSGSARVTIDGALLAGAHRAALGNVSATWRSTEDRAGSMWHARAGFSVTGNGAPLALWPGAGTGQGRNVLLRAHPLLDDGSVRGVFGQRLTHAGGEWRYWLTPTLRALHLAPAVFVDFARAFDVPQFGDGRTHADVGVGLRVAVPGAGVLRVDLARGLRDGATTLSLGWWR
jgi:hypothetical protein